MAHAKHQQSGGARAVAKKHQQRNAERGPRYTEQAIAKVRRLPKHPKTALGALETAMDRLRLALDEASTDPGLPPEMRREQVGRLAAALGKLSEPLKQIQELNAELRAAHAVIVGLREHDGVPEHGGAPSGPPSEDQH